MARLTETVYQEQIERVDAANGVLYGVKLLGENSRNKRKYSADAMRKAVSKYDGVKSYVDHPDRERLNEDRKFEAWSGVFKNPRYVEGKGIFGDLHLRQKGTYFEGIIEAAQKFPTAIGFSHVAEGESSLDGETEIIESIREVFSVDLVQDPATTAGIFESAEQNPARDLREAVEALPDSHPLREQLGLILENAYMQPGTGFGQNQPTDPVGQLTALVGQLTSALADALKSIAKSNKPAAPVVPPAAPGVDPTKPSDPSKPAAADPFAAEGEPDEEEDDMTDDDKEKIAAFEAMQLKTAELKAKTAELEAKTLLLESGRTATSVRVKALANCTTDEERNELLESWPKIETANRPARSPAASLLEDGEELPDDPAKFAAMLR